MKTTTCFSLTYYSYSWNYSQTTSNFCFQTCVLSTVGREALLRIVCKVFISTFENHALGVAWKAEMEMEKCEGIFNDKLLVKIAKKGKKRKKRNNTTVMILAKTFKNPYHCTNI